MEATKYEIPHCLPDWVALMGREAEDWSKLPHVEAMAELYRELDSIVSVLDAYALPPVCFDSWFNKAFREARSPGQGALRWPDDPAKRLTLMLRLLWRAATESGFLGAFNVAFVKGTNFMNPDDHGAFFDRILHPFVRRFDRFSKSGHVHLYPDFLVNQRESEEVWYELLIPGPPEVTIPAPRLQQPGDEAVDSKAEPPAAIECSTHTGGKLTPIGESRLDHLLAWREDCDHFLDATGRPAIAYVQTPGGCETRKLGGWEVAMLRAMVKWAVDVGGPYDFENAEVDGVSTPVSRKKAFEKARRHIDYVARRGVYRLFRWKKGETGQARVHWFEPADEVTYCFLFAPPVDP